VPAQSRFLWRVTPPATKALGKLVSLRVEIEEDLPEPPFVIAANHYSHFDSPVIEAAVNLPIRFLALEDLFGVNRFLDWLIVGHGAIPTPRDRRPVASIRTALAALGAGEIVALFPEATRVSHWGTLEPKRGAAWLALQSKVPLVPVAIIGTGKTFGLENRLRLAPMRAVIGRALPPEGDSYSLNAQWSHWMTKQIARFPDSEVSGPRRSFHQGQ
jgi:1-acyl-sn-glycerol-3-phosphate acyltransferase